MNHILNNIAIIIILFGIILFTKTIAEANKNCDCSMKLNNIPDEPLKKDFPSKVFNSMFTQPSVWMGYADFDSKNFIKNKNNENDSENINQENKPKLNKPTEWLGCANLDNRQYKKIENNMESYCENN
jgi:hypothetical protein